MATFHRKTLRLSRSTCSLLLVSLLLTFHMASTAPAKVLDGISSDFNPEQPPKDDKELNESQKGTLLKNGVGGIVGTSKTVQGIPATKKLTQREGVVDKALGTGPVLAGETKTDPKKIVSTTTTTPNPYADQKTVTYKREGSLIRTHGV